MDGNGLSDEFIVCDECDKLYKRECSNHGPLRWIKDSSRQQNYSHALSSLPKVLSLKNSAVCLGDLGVFAAENINIRVKFGPFVGKQISVEDVSTVADQDYMWDIFNNWIHSHILDATDENQSNWMRFVKFASKKEEQNLVAYQYCGELFYRTCREIKAGEELLVWYEDEYCCKLEELCDQTMTLEGARFFCRKCNIAFLGSTFLSKHNKYRCGKKIVENFDCWICQEEFTTKKSMLTHLDDHMKGIKAEVKEECTETMIPHIEQPVVKGTPSKLVQEGNFECKECRRFFRTQKGLSNHKWYHNRKSEKLHHGKVCVQGALKKSHPVQIHSQDHMKRKKYSCEICRRPCGSQLALGRHMASSHWIKRTSRHMQGGHKKRVVTAK